jgi:hypothetical protein
MKARLTISVMLLLSAIAVMADGSDPMPLCRPTSTKSCPKVIMPVYADGGPLFLCPPRSKTCKCTLPNCN